MAASPSASPCANANASAFLLLVAAFILAMSTTTSAKLNITRALSKYPEYSTLSSLFRETKLAEAINKRQTITILALDNDAIRLIADRPRDELRDILMNHIILDYYDKKKIRGLKKSILLTTMYQTTGLARDNEGFVNMTKRKPGDVVFGSGERRAPLVSKLLGPVITRPFNLSVLHVSLPIVSPDFGDPIKAPPPPPGETDPPAGSPKKSKSKSKSKSGEAPSPDDEAADDGEADSPSPSPSSTTPSPSPSDSPAPKASKAESPSKDDADDADDTADDESGSSRIIWSRVLGVAAAVMGLVANLVAF